jgi:hypothetical protein
VGHLARMLEAGGIATIVVAARPFRHRLVAMSIPRLVLTPHPMGRVFSAPGDAAQQRAVLLAALELLETATEGNTVLELPSTYQLG